MADPLGPAHLADVNEPLDAVLQLHEGAVAHHVDDRALADSADRILVGHLRPRAGGPLLHAQRDLLPLAVDVEHLHLDLLVDLHHLARMADAAPAHVGDMKQAVDAAQIDERAEVGDVLDDPTANLPHLERLHELLLPLGPLLFDERPSRHDDVAPRLVDLQHEALNGPAAVIADVGGAADVDLARRQEDVDAGDVHQQTTLDLAGDETGDHVVLVDALHHAQPVFDPARLPLGERDQPPLLLDLTILELLEQDLDDVANLRRRLGLIPFVPRDVAFALIAHVNEHKLVIDPQHLPLEHRVDRQRGGSDRVFALFRSSQGEFQFLIEFVSEFKFANEVAVDHAWGGFG